ncbi:MAG TPA: serine hydrolase domain-containing protein [Jiangellaceae bacterium]
MGAVDAGLLDSVAGELAAGIDGTTDAVPPPGVIIAVRRGGVTTSVARGDRQRLTGTRPLDGSAPGSLSRLDPPLPMTTATQLDAASITKLVATTAAVMRLVDGGTLALDAAAASFLPARGDGAKASVTVEDLLLHRGGLQPWWPLYYDARTPDEGIALAAALPLGAAPRTVRSYSDLGFVLLGRVVEVVSGQPLADAVRTLVHAPVGMTQTGYGRPTHDGAVAAGSLGDLAEYRMIRTGEPYPVPQAVADFDGWRDHVLVGEVNDGNAFHTFGGCSGHAGLFTTVDDLLTFGDAVSDSLRGDGVWSRETMWRFLTPGPDAEQALGFRHEVVAAGGRRLAVVGHPGYTGSAVGIVPELGATIVLATNRLHVDGLPTPHPPMWRHLLRRVLPALAADTPSR